MFASAARTAVRANARPMSGKAWQGITGPATWHPKADMMAMVSESAVGTVIGIVVALPMAAWMSGYKSDVANYYDALAAKK
jgi:hypothetical protein